MRAKFPGMIAFASLIYSKTFLQWSLTCPKLVFWFRITILMINTKKATIAAQEEKNIQKNILWTDIFTRGNLNILRNGFLGVVVLVIKTPYNLYRRIKKKMKNDWLKDRLQILLLIISLFKRINVWTNNPFKYTYLQTSFSDFIAKIILKCARNQSKAEQCQERSSWMLAPNSMKLCNPFYQKPARIQNFTLKIYDPLGLSRQFHIFKTHSYKFSYTVENVKIK